jgi:MoaA/NifB/PqqE/SkfB family radical SAM enzyme
MSKRQAAGVAIRGGANHVLQHAAPQIVATLARPTTISVMVTRQCNLRCVMCGIPDTIWPHLTVDQWKAVFDDIGKWAGGYCKVQFSGGEPLIFKGIEEILEHCVGWQLMPGITTNGTLVDPDRARELMSMGLANVNVSLDGIGKTHDDVRGFNAAHKKIEVWSKTDAGIRNLMAARTEKHSGTAVFLKCCLMATNADDVEPLVEYTREVGATGITFQPIDVRDVAGHETRTLISDQDKLVRAADTLVRLKEAGAPITNSLPHLRLFGAYFKDPFAKDGYEGRQQCRIGNTSVEIHSDGRAQFCHSIGVLGNVVETPLSQIWRSAVASGHRETISVCTKGCLQTCYANKSLAQKARMFLKIVRS